jgi:hypothetical protein
MVKVASLTNAKSIVSGRQTIVSLAQSWIRARKHRKVTILESFSPFTDATRSRGFLLSKAIE